MTLTSVASIITELSYIEAKAGKIVQVFGSISYPISDLENYPPKEKYNVLPYFCKIYE